MPKQTRTLDVIAAVSTHPKNDREVIIAGEVAEIYFPGGKSLSLLASKLFVQLLELAGPEVVADREHRATMRELNWSHRELNALEEVIAELHQTRIAMTVNTRHGKRRRSGVVLSDMDRPVDTSSGEIVWRFSRTFQSVINHSHHWAAISGRAVLAMECKYAPWLYQLAALHAGRRRVSHDFDLDDLRHRLGATAPSLRIWQQFKCSALEPAVAEINHLTGIGIAWEPLKRGRRVVAVRLWTWQKDQAELDATDAELERHRTGRKARRGDTVERIIEERAALRRRFATGLAAMPTPSTTGD